MLIRVWTEKKLLYIAGGLDTLEISMVTIEISMKFPQNKQTNKTKLELTYGIDVLLLDIYSNDSKSTHHRHTCTSIFFIILVTEAKV